MEGHEGFEPPTIGFEDQDSSTELMSLKSIITKKLFKVNTMLINISMTQISKYPVAIFSAPRTGSTALILHIQSLCAEKIPYFIEPDYNNNNRMVAFEKFFNYSKKFIVKLHAHNEHHYPTEIVDFLRNDTNVFRVRIRRHDIIKQIASLYSVLVRGKMTGEREIYNYSIFDIVHEKRNLSDDVLIIDKERMKRNVKFILKANKTLNESTLNFDMDLYYEDIVDDLKRTTTVEYPKPKNYDEILQEIEKIYKEEILNS